MSRLEVRQLMTSGRELLDFRRGIIVFARRIRHPISKIVEISGIPRTKVTTLYREYHSLPQLDYAIIFSSCDMCYTLFVAAVVESIQEMFCKVYFYNLSIELRKT